MKCPFCGEEIEFNDSTELDMFVCFNPFCHSKALIIDSQN